MYWTTKRIALLALCATALIVNFHTANAATFEIVGGSPLSTRLRKPNILVRLFRF